MAQQNNTTNQKIVTSLRVDHLLTGKSPFDVKEAYKSARTNIMFSITKPGCKVIILTSAFPKEGKTTTCVNIAIAFAQTTSKVLIIDCDLRKPRLHKIFKIKDSAGVTNILGGMATIDDTVKQTGFYGLEVLPAGTTPPNPAELLASDGMKNLIEELSTRYDYIFIDTPPVNVVTDAVVLSPLISGLFFVARQKFTDHRSIKDALAKLELANIKPNGFILNDVDEYSSKYKYGYKRYGKYTRYRRYTRYGRYSKYNRYGYGKYGYGGYDGYGHSQSSNNETNNEIK
ncbi:MAG: CpsD/CapB family tyrosine-protein kinase [Eubacteriales bacterium]|nr:CpsD/CapB family tyrosine-protein kinase [Eubacteriales bacterium]